MTQTQEAAPVPVAPRKPRTAMVILAAVAAILAVGVVGTMIYFSAATAPIALGDLVVVGPECHAQPAIRVEVSYLNARQKQSSVARSEFAGVKFYRNVPWGPAEQSAPVGPP